MNNKKLLLILLGLVGLYFVAQLFGGRKERTFKTDIVQVDTSIVTAIELLPKSAQQEKVRLQKQADGSWQLTQSSLQAAADPQAIQSLLASLAMMKAKRVAAKKEEKWKDYEVDEAGSKVKAYAGDKLLTDFVVGRFSFDQATRSGTSFVRLANEPEVYAVDGFLSLSFNQDAAAYRIKTIVDTRGATITSVSWQNADERFEMARTPEGQWLANGAELLDSAKVAAYISGLSSVNGTEFYDQFDVSNAPPPQQIVQIGGDNMTPLKINCYYLNGAENPFIIKSSANEAYFTSDSSGVYERIFKSISGLQMLTY